MKRAITKIILSVFALFASQQAMAATVIPITSGSVYSITNTGTEIIKLDINYTVNTELKTMTVNLGGGNAEFALKIPQIGACLRAIRVNDQVFFSNPTVCIQSANVTLQTGPNPGQISGGMAIVQSTPF